MKNEAFQEGAIKVAEKLMKLTFSHKHMKSTSNVKQFSLKTNWQDSYSRGYKKDTHRIRKGRKAIRTGCGPLGEDSDENGDYSSRHLPWGVSSSSNTSGAPVWGLTEGR